MKARTKVLALVLALTMALSLAPMALAAENRANGSYADVEAASAFFEAAEYLRDNGYMIGTGDNRFSPELELSRAMAVTVLYRMAGEPETPAQEGYSDVPEGEWYYQPVRWAVSQGITVGNGDGTFAPDRSLTDVEAAAFLARYEDLAAAEPQQGGQQGGGKQGGRGPGGGQRVTELTLEEAAALLAEAESAADNDVAKNNYKTLAEIYQKGSDKEGYVQKDEGKALEYYLKAGEKGDALSYVNAGDIVLGKGERETAIEYYELGSATGNPKGYRNIGTLYEEAGEYEKALEYFTKALNLGDVSSNDYIGKLYEEGKLGAADLEKAAEYYLAGVSRKNYGAGGINHALYRLGYFYENGLGGLKKNLGRAADMYTLASQNGNADAGAALSAIYANAKTISRGEFAVMLYSFITSTGYIQSVKGIGFVDADGSKLKAIAVEYAGEIDAASVSAEDFEIENYALKQTSFQAIAGASQTPGAITKVYVNDVPEIAEKGKESGKYVIIEVDTNYMLDSVAGSYAESMIIGVKQTGEITGESGVISAGGYFVRNYTMTETQFTTRSGEVRTRMNYTVENGSFTIPDAERFELHYSERDKDMPLYDAEYPAFQATECFEEADGKLYDVELPYALFVPEDYDPAQKYALVLHIHDAGYQSTDPMVTLTEGQGPVNFASDEVQQLAKDQGLGGVIVLAPAIENSLRSTRDNWTLSAAVPATWQLMDSITEKYSIDMDRIYGTGQSMGGMQVTAMAAQRDNYFAGQWYLGMQWGNNYNKSEPYTSFGAEVVCAPSDDKTIWREDADGNDSDLGQNWYYLISDDNILFTNCVGDAFSSGVWMELNYLYSDIADSPLPKSAFSPLELTVEEQNAKLEDLLATDAGRINIRWQAFDGGSHMLTWVYGHRLSSGYKWLLSQTRQSEMERSKLTELNNEWAAETDAAKLAQKQTEERLIGTDSEGNTVYYAVPAEGAGTLHYNSGWFNGNRVTKAPGWSVTSD